MQNVMEAIEEVNLIKKVIDRTQNDFSRIADFLKSKRRWYSFKDNALCKG